LAVPEDEWPNSHLPPTHLIYTYLSKALPLAKEATQNHYVTYSRMGDQYVDGRIILRWIFRMLEGVVGTAWSWLRIEAGGGHLWVR
jgi:hypothetical protein